jgi:photosystem II stability/assembly factor-like uncharacterized protein
MTDQPRIGDAVYSLAASPDYARDGLCFAACGSGLYRSEDGGRTWRDAYAALDLQAPLMTTSVAVGPDATSVYAGVIGGILRSFDGGKNWLIAELPSPPPAVSTVVLSPNYANDGTALAGTVEDGVFRSADRGSKWASWNFGLLDLNIYSLAISPGFDSDDTLYVGTETGVFQSTNGGRAWRESGLDIELAPVISLALSPSFANDGTLFAGTESSGLLRSQDGGLRWERIGREAVTGAVNVILLAPDFPARPHLLVLAEEALLVSRDGGASWSEWVSGRGALEATCIAAPQGLELGAPLLVGLSQGGVLLI